MNKCILIAVALLVVVVFAQCNKDDLVVEDIETENKDEVNKNNVSKIKKKYLRFKKKYNYELREMEKHCPGVNEKVKHFEECVENMDQTFTLCSMAETFILNCTLPLLKVEDECLPERIRGLTILGAKILYSIIDYLCKETGETIFEFVNPCVWYRWVDVEKDDDEVWVTHIKQCKEKIINIETTIRRHEPSKSEICSEAASLRSCVDELVSTPCKSPKTRRAFLGLYDAIVAPCSNINDV